MQKSLSLIFMQFSHAIRKRKMLWSGKLFMLLGYKNNFCSSTHAFDWLSRNFPTIIAKLFDCFEDFIQFKLLLVEDKQDFSSSFLEPFESPSKWNGHAKKIGRWETSHELQLVVASIAMEFESFHGATSLSHETTSVIKLNNLFFKLINNFCSCWLF